MLANACHCEMNFDCEFMINYKRSFSKLIPMQTLLTRILPPHPPPHKPVEHRFIDIFVLKMKGIKFSKVKLLPGRTTLNSISASGTASLESFRSAKKLTTFTTPTTY